MGTQVSRECLSVRERGKRNTFNGFALAIELRNLMNRLVLTIGKLVNDPFASIGGGSVLERGNLRCQINSIYRLIHGGSIGYRLTTDKALMAFYDRTARTPSMVKALNTT